MTQNNRHNALRSLLDAFVSEFSLIIRDQGILVFLVLLPLFYPLVYSLIYNPELVRDVTVVVVDHDHSSRSRELVRMLDATQEAKIIGYAADLDEARHAMNSHRCYGILEIPEGFQRSIGRNKTAHAVIYAEMSLLLRYRALLLAASNVSSVMGQEILSEDINEVMPLASTVMTDDPMHVSSASLGNTTGGFDSFVMPGVLILILQQSIVLAVGMAGGNRRERRLYGRNSLDGPLPATLTGRTLCYLIMAILPAIYALHYVPLIFSFPMTGNSLQIYAFILPMIIASIMLGFCLQLFVRERESVFIIWVVTSVIFLFLSGLTWPRYAMSLPWLIAGDCVPATFGVLGFVRLNANGADLSQVANEYVALWIQAVVYTTLAIAAQWYLRRRHGITQK